MNDARRRARPGRQTTAPVAWTDAWRQPPCGESAMTRTRNWIWALAAAAIWFLAAHVQNGPESRGPDTAPELFSAARAQLVLNRIQQSGRPHPVGSVENAAIHARVRRELDALAVPVTAFATRQCFSEPRWSAVTCADITDLIAEVIPGSGKAVILMAHLDSVPAGPGAAPALRRYWKSYAR